ncbi:hypothetical protein M408DRAFT_253434 [Serendipita vermifera MAFF 305830]|uniref:Uncharacterized protein n=1 Tax=Serendipita vermifera MAFF 305830 TaxID=933852 RepID=A0A0C2X2A5_SERVB|nr:hypothetical protein M408DRAFT_253434 [Serendipita vermifera MAFF 305830]
MYPFASLEVDEDVAVRTGEGLCAETLGHRQMQGVFCQTDGLNAERSHSTGHLTFFCLPPGDLGRIPTGGFRIDDQQTPCVRSAQVARGSVAQVSRRRSCSSRFVA